MSQDLGDTLDWVVYSREQTAISCRKERCLGIIPPKNRLCDIPPRTLHPLNIPTTVTVNYGDT